MSEPEKKPEQRFNPLGFLKFRGTDQRFEGVKALLSSDVNNETKTRIPVPSAMSYLDLLGAWSSPTDKITFTFEGKEKTLPKTVSGLAEFFGMRYRINAISAGGQSRAEYVEAYKSYLVAQQQVMAQSSEARMAEGAKKK